jgi:hypothetical protein
VKNNKFKKIIDRQKITTFNTTAMERKKRAGGVGLTLVPNFDIHQSYGTY